MAMIFIYSKYFKTNLRYAVRNFAFNHTSRDRQSNKDKFELWVVRRIWSSRSVEARVTNDRHQYCWSAGYWWKLCYCWEKGKKERGKAFSEAAGEEKGAPVEIGLLLVEEVEEGGECTDRERRGKVGCELEEKERFWRELDEVMESIPTGERVVIGADFNGHVGEGNTGDEEVMGKFAVKERNLEGQLVVVFAKRMDMGVVNTYFQKREEHRVTYKSGGRSTQVDYILCRRGNLKEISDCKVVVGESVARQHRLVVCRMTLMVCKKKRSEIEKKTKWWKLKKEECCEEFRQKLRQALGGQVVLPDD
ncbi:hypothetical protein QTP86_003353 [Hemibagrus guttatus]|nr:hypothetical protein QTP86_003353 [Hemibagrus guttatus]